METGSWSNRCMVYCSEIRSWRVTKAIPNGSRYSRNSSSVMNPMQGNAPNEGGPSCSSILLARSTAGEVGIRDPFCDVTIPLVIFCLLPSMLTITPPEYEPRTLNSRLKTRRGLASAGSFIEWTRCFSSPRIERARLKISNSTPALRITRLALNKFGKRSRSGTLQSWTRRLPTGRGKS